MTDRTELFEATLDGLTEGVALFGQEELVAYWNPAAESITGYTSVELLGRPLPEALEPLLHCSSHPGAELFGDTPRTDRGSLVLPHHKLGQDLHVIARILVLRSGMNGRVGTAVLFHSSEGMENLPHGEDGMDQSVQASQTELEDRLQKVFEDFLSGGPPFGILWITVDQSQELRKTHGAGACEAMLEKIQRAMANGLRPGEEMGRWGQDEYLIVSHLPTIEMLTSHAQVLAGIARTADFRWWGDRVSLTVSMGAAQCQSNESLAALLERAKAAMFSSFHAGGNQITSVSGRQECSPS